MTLNDGGGPVPLHITFRALMGADQLMLRAMLIYARYTPAGCGLKEFQQSLLLCKLTR